MDTLLLSSDGPPSGGYEPLPFGRLGTRFEISQISGRAYLERHLPPSFLFLQRMISLVCLRSRAVRPSFKLRGGAPRGRRTTGDAQSRLPKLPLRTR